MRHRPGAPRVSACLHSWAEGSGMDKESRSAGGGFSSSGIVAIVMLTAGVLFIRDVPLETTRLPVNEPRIQQASVMQDVDARLWQDPFGAIARAREEAAKRDAKKAAEADKRHTARALREDIVARMATSGRKVEVFAVMLPGGPYSDNIESRRRTRYAVLAGLSASRLAPVDSEHLGYFFPVGVDVPPTPELPEIVPFEWFEPAIDGTPRKGDEIQPLILVMWLDGNIFAGGPLGRIRDLIARFDPVKVNWRVLGPSGSDELRSMVDELRQQGADKAIGKSFANLPLRFYSASATAPDERIFANLPEADLKLSLSAYLAQNNVHLVRTIGDDDKLAKALIDELKLRGLTAGTVASGAAYGEACDRTHPNDEGLSHIAVIAEWDTLYGRTLRREFRAGKQEEGFCVNRFTYVRGIDGQLPAGNADGAASKSSSDKSGAGNKDDNRRRDGTFVEIAEGQSQFDYLRRLSVRMRELDRQLRESSSDGKGLRAIGVLGSDVHDKLLVLQALQPEFPNAMFFTTDLDARYLHPRERAWTRNLIVGSNFGLRLGDRLQAGVPPFRDSYQTSAFLSTRIAMDDARRALVPHDASASDAAATPQDSINMWFKPPRLFEIGRTTAFDYSTPTQEVMPSVAPTAGQKGAPRQPCEGPRWDACGGIHPSASPAYPQMRFATMAALFSALILPLWLPVITSSQAVRKRLRNFMFVSVTGDKRVMRWVGLIALLFLLHVAIPMALAANWERFAQWLTAGGKPLVMLEGISIWPTEGIRILSLLLCLYMIFSGWSALSENLDDIILRFRLRKSRRQLIEDQRKAEIGLPWWKKVANMFSFRFTQPEGAGKVGCVGTSGTIIFWRRYIVQNRISARATRTTACVLIALCVSGVLWLAMRDGWFIPQRGPLVLSIHRWLHALMILAMYFLVFFVVDATAFCVSFVHGLRVHGANWPRSTVEKFEDDLHVPRAYLDNWIDLEFIALRTKCVTRLIYFPFIVLSLFLLSRSAAFDDWYMPATGIVLSVLGASIALACAVALRFAAEKSREHAMDLLRDALVRVSGDVKPKAEEVAAGAAPVGQFDDPDDESEEPDEDPGKCEHVPPPEPPKAAQLSLLLARMDSLHEGAFAPFWQQPLLKAVLLPFATLGGSTLLDYLALVNV
ncbi:hypothetical protein QTI66_20410 [Variovorax sp. J22R133]|uniref:hypothetical protein n=1 Tax=Variovorax brevis TaxID=3053503 RepID=UPI0025785B89|nr:hypothetical protein [Variovorax sp. J22R133]MDM0114527.1 hypothetical protein [Variovorax sp. J22R133]